jgi:hypothetical protein
LKKFLRFTYTGRFPESKITGIVPVILFCPNLDSPDGRILRMENTRIILIIP